jgi:hypothetical protein
MSHASSRYYALAHNQRDEHGSTLLLAHSSATTPNSGRSKFNKSGLFGLSYQTVSKEIPLYQLTKSCDQVTARFDSCCDSIAIVLSLATTIVKNHIANNMPRDCVFPRAQSSLLLVTSTSLFIAVK